MHTGTAQPVWTTSLATDLRVLQDRANQAAAAGSTAEARRWKELARKAELLQAQVMESGRTGADLFRSQEIGLDCLDRHAEEREALRTSLEVAVAEPALYAESLALARTLGDGARVLVGIPERHLLTAASLKPGDEAFASLFAEFIVEQSGGADEPVDRRVFELVDGRLVDFAG